MLRPFRSRRLATCLFALLATGGGAGLAAFAGPELTAAAEPVNSDAPFTVTCWQEGREILSETSRAALSAFDIRSAQSIGLGTTQGDRTALVALDETFCRIDYSEQ
ncbi:MAG: hypothetical protein AAGJ32_07980 [Pseudomonadota bacterium]